MATAGQDVGQEDDDDLYSEPPQTPASPPRMTGNLPITILGPVTPFIDHSDPLDVVDLSSSHRQVEHPNARPSRSPQSQYPSATLAPAIPVSNAHRYRLGNINQTAQQRIATTRQSMMPPMASPHLNRYRIPNATSASIVNSCQYRPIAPRPDPAAATYTSPVTSAGQMIVPLTSSQQQFYHEQPQYQRHQQQELQMQLQAIQDRYLSAPSTPLLAQQLSTSSGHPALLQTAQWPPMTAQVQVHQEFFDLARQVEQRSRHMEQNVGALLREQIPSAGRSPRNPNELGLVRAQQQLEQQQRLEFQRLQQQRLQEQQQQQQQRQQQEQQRRIQEQQRAMQIQMQQVQQQQLQQQQMQQAQQQQLQQQQQQQQQQQRMRQYQQSESRQPNLPSPSATRTGTLESAPTSTGSSAAAPNSGSASLQRSMPTSLEIVDRRGTWFVDPDGEGTYVRAAQRPAGVHGIKELLGSTSEAARPSPPQPPPQPPPAHAAVPSRPADALALPPVAAHVASSPTDRRPSATATITNSHDARAADDDVVILDTSASSDTQKQNVQDSSSKSSQFASAFRTALKARKTPRDCPSSGSSTASVSPEPPVTQERVYQVLKALSRSSFSGTINPRIENFLQDEKSSETLVQGFSEDLQLDSGRMSAAEVHRFFRVNSDTVKQVLSKAFTKAACSRADPQPNPGAARTLSSYQPYSSPMTSTNAPVAAIIQASTTPRSSSIGVVSEVSSTSTVSTTPKASAQSSAVSSAVKITAIPTILLTTSSSANVPVSPAAPPVASRPLSNAGASTDATANSARAAVPQPTLLRNLLANSGNSTPPVATPLAAVTSMPAPAPPKVLVSTSNAGTASAYPSTEIKLVVSGCSQATVHDATNNVYTTYTVLVLRDEKEDMCLLAFADSGLASKRPVVGAPVHHQKGDCYVVIGFRVETQSSPERLRLQIVNTIAEFKKCVLRSENMSQSSSIMNATHFKTLCTLVEAEHARSVVVLPSSHEEACRNVLLPLLYAEPEIEAKCEFRRTIDVELTYKKVKFTIVAFDKFLFFGPFSEDTSLEAVLSSLVPGEEVLVHRVEALLAHKGELAKRAMLKIVFRTSGLLHVLCGELVSEAATIFDKMEQSRSFFVRAENVPRDFFNHYRIQVVKKNSVIMSRGIVAVANCWLKQNQSKATYEMCLIYLTPNGPAEDGSSWPVLMDQFEDSIDMIVVPRSNNDVARLLAFRNLYVHGHRVRLQQLEPRLWRLVSDVAAQPIRGRVLAAASGGRVGRDFLKEHLKQPQVFFTTASVLNDTLAKTEQEVASAATGLHVVRWQSVMGNSSFASFHPGLFNKGNTSKEFSPDFMLGREPAAAVGPAGNGASTSAAAATSTTTSSPSPTPTSSPTKGLFKTPAAPKPPSAPSFAYKKLDLSSHAILRNLTGAPPSARPTAAAPETRPQQESAKANPPSAQVPSAAPSRVTMPSPSPSPPSTSTGANAPSNDHDKKEEATKSAPSKAEVETRNAQEQVGPVDVSDDGPDVEPTEPRPVSFEGATDVDSSEREARSAKETEKEERKSANEFTKEQLKDTGPETTKDPQKLVENAKTVTDKGVEAIKGFSQVEETTNTDNQGKKKNTIELQADSSDEGEEEEDLFASVPMETPERVPEPELSAANEISFSESENEEAPHAVELAVRSVVDKLVRDSDAGRDTAPQSVPSGEQAENGTEKESESPTAENAKEVSLESVQSPATTQANILVLEANSVTCETNAAREVSETRDVSAPLQEVATNPTETKARSDAMETNANKDNGLAETTEKESPAEINNQPLLPAQATVTATPSVPKSSRKTTMKATKKPEEGGKSKRPPLVPLSVSAFRKALFNVAVAIPSADRENAEAELLRYYRLNSLESLNYALSSSSPASAPSASNLETSAFPSFKPRRPPPAATFRCRLCPDAFETAHAREVHHLRDHQLRKRHASGSDGEAPTKSSRSALVFKNHAKQTAAAGAAAAGASGSAPPSKDERPTASDTNGAAENGAMPSAEKCNVSNSCVSSASISVSSPSVPLESQVQCSIEDRSNEHPPRDVETVSQVKAPELPPGDTEQRAVDVVRSSSSVSEAASSRAEDDDVLTSVHVCLMCSPPVAFADGITWIREHLRVHTERVRVRQQNVAAVQAAMRCTVKLERLEERLSDS